MNAKLSERCELFANNRDVDAKFIWDPFYMVPVAAAYQTNEGKTADAAKMKECAKILKKHVGAFSEFRNNMRLSMISKMSLSDDPTKYLEGVLEVYKKLKDVYTFGSAYLVLAAMVIYDHKDSVFVDTVIEKSKNLLTGIKKDHPFITSREDLSMIAMLAMLDRSEADILNDVEQCYQLLKKEMPMHSNSLQTISFVLATSTMEPSVKVERFMSLKSLLSEKNVNCHVGSHLASVASCAIMDCSLEDIASDIADANAYLKGRKGFGAWGVGKNARIMYAAMLVGECYSTESAASMTGVTASAIAATIAAQVAILCAIAASSSNATRH